MTAWIALVALAFTGTQAWIALRKLRLDLFEKRFQAYEAINTAINDRRAEMGQRDSTRPLEPDIEVLRRIWVLQRQMRVLFPVDVSDCLTRIDAALIACDVAHMEWRSIARVAAYSDPKETGAKHTASMKADQDLRAAQDELARLTHRYIRQYGWVELAGVHARRWTESRMAQFVRWYNRVRR